MKAAFLDRDGVINIDHAYVGRWEDFEFVPGAIDAMRLLHQAGYALVVVTNQSGIARGKYSEAEFLRLSERMSEFLLAQQVPLAAVEYCPHLPDGQVPEYRRDCDCRKPAPGMILRAARRLQLDLDASVLFGDKPSDIEAAQAAGLGRAFLVAKDGRGEPAGLPVGLAAERCGSLALAVSVLLA
ncbi:D-glycero-beta-D-manno-heptose 1,7-bisphosphate 7-phosphatase [Paucibacter sp. B2R-40]|uniref:D-glycero-beta-D-manno-heptose 1,7-bisphosphate 7-phosphatase n=1 Tax=Paucibacter sp. B2R-40 TaxID=2893554 RepID=UPI0021E418EF|nr:D-glycero-beta-D-manno-heptose 1,7-bisphosphate 7-phosphatase [Paucibacter sp. B2R-40]MCV2354051.1 D-glycero-beta-D-manno-heptose 1,7-bisphosphate 7-phosphatase [Paucibacter sp. B2R-40]